MVEQTVPPRDQWANGVLVGVVTAGPHAGRWVIVEAVDSIHGDAEPDRYRVTAAGLTVTMDDGDEVLMSGEHSPQDDGSADLLTVVNRDFPLRWSTTPADVRRARRDDAEQGELLIAALPARERRFIRFLQRQARRHRG